MTQRLYRLWSAGSRGLNFVEWLRTYVPLAPGLGSLIALGAPPGMPHLLLTRPLLIPSIMSQPWYAQLPARPAQDVVGMDPRPVVLPFNLHPRLGSEHERHLVHRPNRVRSGDELA